MEDKALATIKEILIGRGMKDNKFEPISGDLPETKMYTYEKLLVLFSNKSRITGNEFKNFTTFATENNHTGGILIVTPQRPSEMVLKMLCNYIENRENPIVQIFELRHLQFDISKHRKVPVHRIISDKEQTDMLKEHNVTFSNKIPNIPKIWCQDPMAKWIGARPGDYVYCEGLCQASGKDSRYRYCLADVTNG